MTKMNTKYVQYRLSRESFKKLLKERGYKNAQDFCKKTSIHKNTLNYYLSGRDVFSKKLCEIAFHLQVDPIELVEACDTSKIDSAEIEKIVSYLSLEKGMAVALLGSRANGKSQKFSDWDIGVTRGSKKPISGREFLRLRAWVGEVADDLARKVDLVNLDEAPQWFLESIDYEPIFLGGDKETFERFMGVLDGIKKFKVKKSA